MMAELADLEAACERARRFYTAGSRRLHEFGPGPGGSPYCAVCGCTVEVYFHWRRVEFRVLTVAGAAPMAVHDCPLLRCRYVSAWPPDGDPAPSCGCARR